jgi:hypothetical protein
MQANGFFYIYPTKILKNFKNYIYIYIYIYIYMLAFRNCDRSIHPLVVQ